MTAGFSVASTNPLPSEDDEEERKKRRKIVPTFHNTTRPGEPDVNDFWKLASALQTAYKSETAINRFMAPAPVKLVKSTDTADNSALGGHAVQVNGSQNTIHFDIAGHVTIDVTNIDDLCRDAALAAAAVASNPKVKSVEATGSDEEKVIMLIAAQNNGVHVDNAAEINEIDPAIRQSAIARWHNYQRSVGIASITPSDAAEALDAPIGVIASKFTSADNEKAAQIQADLITLVQAEENKRLKDPLPRFRGNLDAKGLKEDKIAELKAQAKIKPEETQAARALVDSGQGVPEGVPKFGQILEANNLIDPQVKDALLLAQAASRTLDIAERINSGKISPATQEDVQKTATSPMFGMVGRFPDESADLVHAQATGAQAALYEKQIGAGMFPQKGPPKIAKGFHKSAIDSLEVARHKLFELGEERAARTLDIRLNSYKNAAEASAPAGTARKAPESVIVSQIERTSTANGIDATQVKSLLSAPIGVIAAQFANINGEDAAAIQADLLALLQAEAQGRLSEPLPRFKDALDAKGLKQDKIAALKTEADITDEEIAAARAVVDSGQGVPPELPKLGQILESYGFIAPELKDVLLTAQAAARTLETAARINTGNVEPSTEADVYATASSNMFGMIGRFPDESADLVQAQATNARISVYEQQIGSGMLPEKGPPKIAKGYEKAAIESLEVVRHKLSELGEANAVAALDAVLDSYEAPKEKPAAQAPATPGAKPQ